MKFLRNDPALKQQRRELRCNQTEAEKTFWAHVRNKQFYGLRFFRQYSIGPYILDFYCPTVKIAVELDGRLIPLLHEIVAPFPNVQILQGHILESTWHSFSPTQAIWWLPMILKEE